MADWNNTPSFVEPSSIHPTQFTKTVGLTDQQLNKIVENEKNLDNRLKERETSVLNLTATLSSSDWVGSSSPFTKSISVASILSTDSPVIDVDLSLAAIDNIENIQYQWSKIYRAVTSNGSIQFYSTEKPNYSFSLLIKVVR